MSKPSFEVITSPKKSQSFVIRRFGRSGFEAPFHFHPEYELTCILEGRGKRFVGNNMTGFQEGDVVLIGSNLPHCWKLPAPEKDAGAIVIQFDPGFLGSTFWNTPEMAPVDQLLQRSGAGIEFKGKINQQVRAGMERALEEKQPFRKLMILLDTLQQLAVSREYTLLNGENPVSGQTADHRERINGIFAYIVDHFREEISLGRAASLAGMTPGAFCKYFKRVTRKTFMETVIDYRISFATQQLVETPKSISSICFESGFRDVSHFYKMFTSRMEMSPMHYRKQFLLETKAGD